MNIGSGTSAAIIYEAPSPDYLLIRAEKAAGLANAAWSYLRDFSGLSDEWSAFMDDLQHTLEKFAVPQPEQEELKAIVESTRESIVVAPLGEPGK